MSEAFEAIEKQWLVYDRLMRYPDSWTDYAESREGNLIVQESARFIPHILAASEPFFWAEDICALVEAAAPTLEHWSPRPEDFLCPYGFSWFARPLHLPVPEELPPIDLHGFLWGPIREKGILLTGIIRAPQPVGYWCGAISICGWGHDLLTAEWIGPEPASVFVTRSQLQRQYIAAALLFMGQRLATRSTERLPRHVLRRLPRQHPETERPLERTEIAVIRLRRPAAARGEADGEPVDWSCRWIVGGHWRNQACGTGRGAHRPVWIAPHLKGPEDKPLKVPARRLFAVVR
jgi:hypothetical protein